MPSSRFADYYYIDVKAWALVNGVKMDIDSADITFALDEIPKARITLPVGRNMTPSKFSKPSPIQGVLSNLLPFTPIEIKMKATPSPVGRAAPSGKDAGFPIKEFTVFKGFISLPAEDKSMLSTASLVIEALGEEVGLYGSTQHVTGATVAHPDSAGNLGVSYIDKWDPAGNIKDTIALNTSNIAGDIWTDGVGKLVETAMQATQVWTGVINNTANTAFERINVGKALPKFALDIGKASTIAYQAALQRALVSQLSDFFQSTWNNEDESDMWYLIKYFGGLFGYSFVPAIEEDSVAPIVRTLGGYPHRVIDPSEYFAVSTAQNYRADFAGLITSVGLYASFQQSNWEPASPSKIVGRAYIDKSALKGQQGRLKLIVAPSWLIPLSSTPKGTIPIGGTVIDKGNIDTPTPAPDPAPQDVEFIGFFDSKRGDLLAQTYLHNLIFRHRSMTVSGRFRLDISPGSLVQVNTVGEKFTGVKDSLFGMVESVSITIGNRGNGGQATTSFVLNSVRSEAEHETMTVGEHPLFGEAWVGGKLLDY